MTKVNRFDHIFQVVELCHNLNSTLTEMNLWLKIGEFYYKVFHELLNSPFRWKGNVKRLLTLFCEAFINFFNKLFPTSLRKKCWYLELFWPVISHIRTEYKEMRSISQYSVQMQENAGKMQTRITPNSNTFYAVHAMDQIDEGHLETFHLFSSISFPVCLSVEITHTGRSMTFKMSKNNERKLLSPLPLSFQLPKIVKRTWVKIVTTNSVQQMCSSLSSSIPLSLSL